MTFPYQHTIENPISCTGIGLHSGANVHMTLMPAPEDTGIVFVRADKKDALVRADYRNVTSTMLGTTISNEEGVSVATVEHLMAAFWGCNIDNARVILDGPEVPIMDGSSEPFVFLIECAGVKKQARHRRMIEVLKKVEVVENDKYMAITPAEHFSVGLKIDFKDKVIATQTGQFNASDVNFKQDLCRARSFCFEHEVSFLREKGLAQGGSLDNAVVVSKTGVLNEGGLRYEDEFVRHKILDCIGDFYLGGAFFLGNFVGSRTGHGLNNKLLHKLFSDPQAWRLAQAPMDFSLAATAGHA